MPSVARMNVTPVKSTSLQHPEEIRLERHGAVGNRDFFFVDRNGHRFGGSKKTPLLAIRAEYDAERDRMTLQLPNGICLSGPATANGEAVLVDFYGRPVPAQVVEGDWEEALSHYTGRDVRLARADAPGGATDVHPVTLVSLASVDLLGRQGGREEPLDPGRFRMLLEIEGCEPHEEDTWRGRAVRAGSAVIGVGDPVPRCVITTLDPATGVKDFPTLSVIKKYRGVTDEKQLIFGVYADVLEPGTIRVGDPVEPLAV